MKNKTIIIVVILLIAIGAFFFFRKGKTKDEGLSAQIDPSKFESDPNNIPGPDKSPNIADTGSALKLETNPASGAAEWVVSKPTLTNVGLGGALSMSQTKASTQSEPRISNPNLSFPTLTVQPRPTATVQASNTISRGNIGTAKPLTQTAPKVR